MALAELIKLRRPGFSGDTLRSTSVKNADAPSPDGHGEHLSTASPISEPVRSATRCLHECVHYG
jgi:hypothetical protein